MFRFPSKVPPGVRRLIRLPSNRELFDRDLDDEWRFHLDARIAEFRALGMSEADAIAEARRRFGDPDELREELGRAEVRRLRRTGFTEWLAELGQDLRYAVLGLARRPGFTAVAVLTLAIGIGGTTAIFSAVNALLLRHLPYGAPDQLMTVSLTVPAGGGLKARDDMVWSYPKYAVFRDAQSIFSDLSLYTPQRFTITSGDVEPIEGEFVGARYLRTLGLAPVRGRDFDPGIDAHGGAERQVIISYSLWQRRFNADPSLVGKTVDLDRDRNDWIGSSPDDDEVHRRVSPYAVVGIAPAGFRGLTGQAEVFVPIATRAPEDLDEETAQQHEFYMVARRKANIGAAAATAAVKLLGARVNAAFPGQNAGSANWGATARPLSDSRVSPLVRRSLLVAFAAVGCVLLIACVNVANLLLGRASTRRREIAVRVAIGASRWRLVRMLLTENMLLATLGGFAGVAVAWASTRALSTIDPDTMVPKGIETLRALGAVTFAGIHLDWATLAFSASITLGAGLLFGFVPALQATGASLADAMKLMAGDNHTHTRRPGRGILVVIEVALAMILLVGSGLLMRSFGKLVAIHPGFDAQHVLTLRLTIPPRGMAEDSMPAFYTELLDRLRGLPGVVDASLNSCPPLGGGCYRTRLEFPDRSKADAARLPSVRVNWATPTWFATLHVPLMRGRLFVGTDRAGTPKVVVINGAAARAFWPGENPLGKRVAVGVDASDAAEVIGIVGDVRQFADSLAKPDVYVPYAQSPISRMMIFVRAGGDPLALAPDIRRTIHELAPQLPVYDIEPMTARAAGATAQARFSAVLLGLFAATALSLAMVGIYGVMALAVTARTREIGIRMALGADARAVRRLVVKDGVSFVSIGVILGLVGALACTRVLQKLLFDLSPTDPVTYCVIVGLLGLATFAASWAPVRRASNVDPVVALRTD